MASLEGKVIALTGAASGMGEATAHLLAARGAKISLADVQGDALAAVRDAILAKHPKAEVMITTVDVRSWEQVEAWITATVAKWGTLNGAANLAGVIPRNSSLTTIADQDFDDWDFVMGVNTVGVMHCLKAQTRVIADNGSIVNASSIAGMTGRPKNAVYAASKHAVTGLTRSVAKEFGVRGIRVNAFNPGWIDTPMSRNAAKISTENDPSEAFLSALRRAGRPEEVAQLVAFLLSDESTYISGANIPIDGGWNC
ncbi:putative secondary metabolism biosynthetic enzyme [Sporothrix eucalyptigena]|uniref:Secondary metabolism biosynthetic enzyme n=1 Tax=Sporothrix eucalyptigena TaxID=1812306 RepID=A0ABP0AXK8_9PEZI